MVIWESTPENSLDKFSKIIKFKYIKIYTDIKIIYNSHLGHNENDQLAYMGILL